MASPSHSQPQSRRQLLTRIGALAGSAALYQAMTSMGHAMGTDFFWPAQSVRSKAGYIRAGSGRRPRGNAQCLRTAQSRL